MDPSTRPNTHAARSGPALIINPGTLPGLVACWSEGVVRPSAARRTTSSGDADSRPMAWFPTDERPARSRRRDAVIRQIDLCSLAGMSERQTIRFEPPAHQPQPAQAALPEPIGAGARATTMLLSAAIEASAIGLDRIIWPVHAGAAKEINTDALADICDRALLVGQLIGLDVAKAGQNGGSGAAPVRSVRIETPYADLNDAELMDLALDMDVPLSAAWWCLNEDPQPCAHCSGCMRWREALAAVDPAGRLDIQVLAATPATHAGPLKQK